MKLKITIEHQIIIAAIGKIDSEWVKNYGETE